MEIGADLIFLQEEKRGKDSMRSHGAFRWIGDERRRTRAAVRVTSNIEVKDQSMIAGPEAATDIQVLDIRMGSGEMIRVVNVYDQARSRNDRTRPCQQADWKRIMDFPGGGIVVAGDMSQRSVVLMSTKPLCFPLNTN